MTPTELKAIYLQHNPGGLFFRRDIMRTHGDTMKNYKVVQFDFAGIHFYELQRRKPVKCGRQNSHYFYFEFENDRMQNTTTDPRQNNAYYYGHTIETLREWYCNARTTWRSYDEGTVGNKRNKEQAMLYLQELNKRGANIPGFHNEGIIDGPGSWK